MLIIEKYFNFILCIKLNIFSLTAGVGPATFRLRCTVRYLTVECSNQLSYASTIIAGDCFDQSIFRL